MPSDVLFKGWSSAGSRPHPGALLYRFLDTNGDGTGTKDAIGTYAGGAQDFSIVCPAGSTYVLHRVIIHYRDVGTVVADLYGSGITLNNGIECKVFDADGSVMVDLLDGVPITANEGWLNVCYDFSVLSALGNNVIFGARWTFAKSGSPIVLRPGQRLSFTLEDDFDDLIEQRFMVQGYRNV